ncbi:MAG: DNA polymerase III subunit delta' C-terminal domain-containing protein [Gammaproteobacteria bacterium]
MTLPWISKHLDRLDINSLPHSILIGGREGLGKTNLAYLINKSILCSNPENMDSCKKCQSCRLFEDGNHPDFHEIDLDEDKKTISINQIRSLYLEMFESSFLGGNKIFYIPRSHLLSRESYDALLKTLEEPPPNTFIVLVNHDSHNLPQTILSRCHKINISKPEPKEIRSWLKSKDIEDSKIDLLIDLAKGNPLKALKMEESNYLDHRNNFISEISTLIKTGTNISNISEQWIKDEEILLLKIEWMTDLLMDILRIKTFNEKNIILADTEKISSYMKDKIDIVNTLNLLDKTIDLWNKLYKNNNLRNDYHLQSLLIDWERSLGLRSQKI